RTVTQKMAPTGAIDYAQAAGLYDRSENGDGEHDPGRSDGWREMPPTVGGADGDVTIAQQVRMPRSVKPASPPTLSSPFQRPLAARRRLPRSTRTRGSVMVTAVPSPTRLVMSRLPPCSSII